MAKRQSIAMLIDVLMCLIPAFCLYTFTGIRIHFSELNILVLTSVTYFLYTLLSVFIGRKKSIGERLVGITLVAVKTKSETTILFFMRHLIVSVMLISISDLEFMFLFLSFVLVVPVKFSSSGFQSYSLLNFLTKTAYI